MIALPVNFIVPEEFASRLASGELVRYGGVLRDGAGQIVVHLKEVPLTREAQEVARRALPRLKEPKVVAAVGLGVIAVTGLAVVAHRRKREIQASVEKYNEAFGSYLRAISNGSLTADIVSELLTRLREIEQKAKVPGVLTGLETDLSRRLVDVVADYSAALAAANGLGSVEDSVAIATKPVARLLHHLEFQHQVLSGAIA